MRQFWTRALRLRTLGAVVAVATVAALVVAGAFAVSGGNTVTRVAGVPKKAFGGFSGDGGPALRAELNVPVGVALDGQGNIFIADRNNDRVRKVSTRGIITTFAGGGSVLGDGGPATSASLNYPWGVAVDGQGNVYFSERSGELVRKVNTNGIISTLAGNGTAGFSGDGGPATAAQVSSPQGVVVDGHGNVYVSDYGNNRVRRVSPVGIITTFAGGGTAGFSGDGGPATAARLHGPAGLALDRQGNLYIADQLNSRIRMVSAGGTITTFAGGGKTYPWGPKGLPARFARVANPFAVAVDAQRSVYIGDGRLIYKVTGGRIALLAGNPSAGPPYSGDNGPARKARLTETWGIAIDTQGNLYFTDIWTQTVRKIWATRTARTSAAFYSPTRNLFCTMADDAARSAVRVSCQSKKLPHSVSMGLAGRLKVCRGIHCLRKTPTGVASLGYGNQITVGRFRCLSQRSGVACAVIASGKGFLINRAGVQRVG